MFFMTSELTGVLLSLYVLSDGQPAHIKLHEDLVVIDAGMEGKTFSSKRDGKVLVGRMVVAGVLCRKRG